MLTVKSLKVGVYRTNCYILYNKNKVLLIDPGSRASKIIDHIKESEVIGILLTHGHLDHIGAVDEIVKTYHCPVYCHKDDVAMLTDTTLNCSYRNNITAYSKVIALSEGKFMIDDILIEAMHTPGHTKGSTIYRIDDFLFTGDTLFKLSVGRTDLPTGDDRLLKNSLKMIKNLDPNLKIYPGHDESTTLRFELENNPYLI
ncbi:MAG: MBL fold metallo-hydrolase [Erysipelotrichaceae bacterium]|nr:MBL fold metallo-hydrolase [Erysipelotrichaceae bacterium]MDD3923503.1 MBL fold metallo-hydrolase [Erysipelotrichaceae bacterium]